jgi:hypothetical protein
LPHKNQPEEMNTGARATAVAVSAMLFTAGCENPFQTRTPEPPTQSRGTFITPLTPEAVIANLRNAVAEQNLVNYSRSLADPARGGTFRYQADPAVENSRPELFANWGLEEEKHYFGQLSAALPPDSTRVLSFTPKSLTTIGDSAVFVEDYQLRVHHTQQAGGIARNYAGQARFILRRDNLGEWAIHRWADFSTGSTPTWSALKASFGQ